MLQDMREGLGLSQEELAGELGISPDEIKQMEDGEIEITLLFLENLKEKIYNVKAPQAFKDMRKALNMSQWTLAKELSYSTEAVSAMELRRRKIPVGVLKQVRGIYNQRISQGLAEFDVLEEEQEGGLTLLQRVFDALGITRTQLAERLDTSISYLNNMFSGSDPVSQPIRDKLNALLSGVDTETFAGQETGPEDSETPEEITVVIPEKTPGNILKEIETSLVDLGVGPEKLAFALDITMSYLRMLESGMVPVSGGKLYRAQEFLEVNRAETERQDALAASQKTEELEVIPAEDSAVAEEEGDSEEVALAEEEPVPTNQTQPAPAKSSISAQILKDIQKQLGLGIDEFAENLGTSSIILRLWISGMTPIPEDVLRMAQGLLSPQDDPARILTDIQAKLRVNRGVYATMLGISYTHLTNVLNYRSAVSAEVIVRAQALLAEKEAEDALQKQPFYPDYIYWRWVLEEVMNILEVNLAGLANKMKIGKENLSLIMTYGHTVSEEILIKAENLLSDEQFEILKQRIGQRIADFEAEVRARHKEEGNSGG